LRGGKVIRGRDSEASFFLWVKKLVKNCEGIPEGTVLGKGSRELGEVGGGLRNAKKGNKID